MADGLIRYALAALIGAVLAMESPVESFASAVDTGQVRCYSVWREIDCPRPGEAFYGQDGNYQGRRPAYRDNRDGTVTDLNTKLMWSKGVDANKVSLEEARAIAARMTLGGHNDWRVPSIKELYSLIDFRGYTGFERGQRGFSSGVPSNAVPFIDIDFFDFQYGNTKGGERFIDAQWLTSTVYVSLTMERMETLFGVNFADGRIKGYGFRPRGMGAHAPQKRFFARYVRGPNYGENRFRDNGDGTVSDLSSGLMWSRGDSGWGMNWEAALKYAEASTLAGYDDWRLPNAKELQYIVDYSRSPDATGSAAIDPVFHASPITNEADQKDWGHYWTSTTHRDGPQEAAYAAYVAFGRAMGRMRGRIMDVHGAGAQRGDPKTGTARIGHGPQGDAQRIDNMVRLVRGGATKAGVRAPVRERGRYPNNAKKVHGLGQKAVAGSNRRMGGGQRMGGEGQSRGGAGFVSRLDRDMDGRVSRQEFDGPPQAFDHHDANRDGYLSQEEAPRFPPPGQGARRPQ